MIRFILVVLQVSFVAVTCGNVAMRSHDLPNFQVHRSMHPRVFTNFYYRCYSPKEIKSVAEFQKEMDEEFKAAEDLMKHAVENDASESQKFKEFYGKALESFRDVVESVKGMAEERKSECKVKEQELKDLRKLMLHCAKTRVKLQKELSACREAAKHKEPPKISKSETSASKEVGEKMKYEESPKKDSSIPVHSQEKNKKIAKLADDLTVQPQEVNEKPVSELFQSPEEDTLNSSKSSKDSVSTSDKSVQDLQATRAHNNLEKKLEIPPQDIYKNSELDTAKQSQGENTEPAKNLATQFQEIHSKPEDSVAQTQGVFDKLINFFTQPLETNDKPEVVVTQPQGSNNKPADFTIKPQGNDGKSDDITVQPQEIKDKSTDLTIQPQPSNDKPVDVTFKPQNMHGKPAKHFQIHPQGTFDKPAGYFTTQPQGTHSKPADMTTQPQAIYIYGKPEDMATQPQIIYNKPTDSTAQPQAIYIYGKPADLTNQHQLIYGKPADTISQPQEVYGKSTDLTVQPPTTFGKSADLTA